MSTTFTKDQLELVATATQFCILMEQAGQSRRATFVNGMLRVLPFLYVKMLMARDNAAQDDDEPHYLEERVTEDDYNYVRQGVQALLGEDDTYLDVFVEDMKYSETPIAKSISEDLADIYQDVRNFLWIVGQRNDQASAEAFAELCNQFVIHWGQLVVNVMRPLHDVRFGPNWREDNDAAQ